MYLKNKLLAWLMFPEQVQIQNDLQYLKDLLEKETPYLNIKFQYQEPLTSYDDLIMILWYGEYSKKPYALEIPFRECMSYIIDWVEYCLNENLVGDLMRSKNRVYELRMTEEEQQILQKQIETSLLEKLTLKQMKEQK